MTHRSPIRSAAASIEEQFELYRQQGDPDRLAEVFDQTAPRLLRLALHLAGSSADAEDLVQATYLRVIEIADRYQAERPLLPWLCGILELEARRQRRTSNRRLDTERLPEASSQASIEPLVGIERKELRARIEEALGNLPVVYRTVVTLKLQHGLTPAEIAVALERSTVAVRTQLHRGLKMLRAALPQTVALAAITTVTSARGLAAVRSTVLEHAKLSYTVPIALQGLGWGVLMSKFGTVLLAATLVLILGALTLVFWPFADPIANRSSADSGTAAGSSDRRLPLGMASPASLFGTERRSLSEDSFDSVEDLSAMASLWVRICYADDRDLGVAGIPIWVASDNGSVGRGEPVLSGADGRVRITDLSPGRKLVRLDRDGPSLSSEAPEGYLRVPHGKNLVETRIVLHAGQVAEIELAIDRELSVRGRVVDTAGQPVSGASIWSARLSSRPHPSDLIAKTGPDGRFVVPAFGMNHWLTARHAKHGPSQSYQPRRPDGEETDVEIVLADLGGAVRGIVAAPDGSPIVGAELIIGRDLFGGDIVTTTACMMTSNAIPARLLAGSDGRYQLVGLAPGKQFVWAVADGFVARVLEFEIVAGAVCDLDISLDKGTTLSGRLRTPEGIPIEGVRVNAWSIPGGVVDPGTGYVRAIADVHTAIDGSYRIIGLPIGQLRLRADAHGYTSFSSELQLIAEQAASLDISLAPLCEIHGTVMDPSGRPLSHWRVLAEPVRGGKALRAELGVDGAFALPADAKQSYLLVVERPGGEHGRKTLMRIPCVWLGEVAGNAGEQNIVIPSEVLHFGGLRGQLTGMPLNAGKSWITLRSLDDKAGHTACSLDARGRFDTGAMVSGRYQVIARMLGSKTLVTLGEWTIEQGDTLDLGALPLPVLGSLRIVVTGSESEATLHARLLDHDGKLVSELYSVNGRIEESLTPGRYRVVPWTLGPYGGGSQWDGKAVLVRADQVTEVQFDSAEKR